MAGYSVHVFVVCICRADTAHATDNYLVAVKYVSIICADDNEHLCTTMKRLEALISVRSHTRLPRTLSHTQRNTIHQLITDDEVNRIKFIETC